MKIKKRISRDMFGASWPFYVSSGILVVDDNQAVYFKHMLKTYGLNGPARLNGGASPDNIWMDSERMTNKMPMTPILNYAIDMYFRHVKKNHE